MKKTVLLIGLVFFSALTFSKEISFYEHARRKEPCNIAYREGDTYKIYAQPLFQNIITFGKDEVEYAETGDNVNFHTIVDKHSIRLKVIDENLNTDLVVKTNRGFYYFKVVSTYGIYNPMINFLYPQDEALKQQQYRRSSEPVNVLNLDELNNNYSISKKYVWAPTQIFDDGQKTYFIMPQKLQEMPVFLVRTEDKEYSIVTFRVKETEGGMRILIVDRLFEEGAMKLGNKKIIIKNKRRYY